MKSFKDSAGRVWEIALNVATIKRVRDTLGVNLLELDDGKLLDRLASDPILLVDVIYVACKAQADKAGVTDEQFGEGMAGEALDGATTALLDELVDFFRDPRRRTVMRELLSKSRQLESKLLEKAEAALTTLDLEKLLASVSSEPAISSPASSG